MNLHHLELFYYVCRFGGISRAARNMPYGIQQPAMSSQILALEEDLGTKLFDRQPFKLTAAGEELYAFARPFFDHAGTVADRLRRQSTPKVRIAASELVLRDYLPPVIETMRQHQPDLRFGLRTGPQSEVEMLLHAQEIDLAIATLDAPVRAGLQSLHITRLPLVLLVPKAAKLKNVADLWQRQPIEEPLICLPSEESVSRAFARGLKKLKVDWPTSIEASSVDLVTRYVANGYGFGVTVDVPELIRHPKIKALPLTDFDPIGIAALWRAPAAPLVETLLKVIEARARTLWPAGERHE